MPSACKIKDCRSGLHVDLHLQFDFRAVIHEVLCLQDALTSLCLRLQIHNKVSGLLRIFEKNTHFSSHLDQHLPDGDLGVLLNEAHVGLNDVQAIAVDELGHELDPLLVCGDLGLEIRQVVLGGKKKRKEENE